MARLYTTEEAYRKLDISQATLYRWITKARAQGFGDKVEAQPSSDGRESLYSLAQLRWLATRHGKELLPDEEIFLQEPQKDVEALRRDLAHVNQIVAARQDETAQLKEEIRRLEQQVNDMDRKVKEAYSFCVQQVSQVLTDLARLRAETRDVPLQRSDVSSPPLTHSQVAAPGREPGGQASATTPRSLPDDLPAGTTSIKSFAEMHDTARDLVVAIIRRGDVEAVARQYKSGLNRVLYFLTPQQQDHMVAYLERQHLPVRRCSACPHSFPIV